MAWKKHWEESKDMAEAAIETCPACTSAVDAQAATCTQCGADLTYYRQQAESLKDSASE